MAPIWSGAAGAVTVAGLLALVAGAVLLLSAYELS